MDRNSAIGLTLIAGLLMAYFYWFSPVPPPPTSQQPTAPSQMGAQDSTQAATPILSDSLLTATYGDLSTAMKGQETPTVIENEDLKLVFSNKGAILSEVELKKYKT